MTLEDYLQKVGLSDKEARLYVTGLQLGPATVQELARDSEIKRTTVYEVIKTLQDKKLINVSQRGKRQIYIMEEPENVRLFLKQKEKVFQRILPELESLKNKDTRKPAVRIFEGKKGLEKIYEDMIKEPSEILALAAPKDLISSGMLEFLRNDWEPRRIKNGIKMRRVNINLTGQKKWDYRIKPIPEELEEIRYLPIDDYPFTIGIYIYRRKVAFVSYQSQEMVGIMLRSPAVNRTMRAVFENYWNTGPVEDKEYWKFGSQATSFRLKGKTRRTKE